MYKDPFIPIGKLDIVKAYHLKEIGKTLYFLMFNKFAYIWPKYSKQ